MRLLLLGIESIAKIWYDAYDLIRKELPTCQIMNISLLIRQSNPQ